MRSGGPVRRRRRRPDCCAASGYLIVALGTLGLLTIPLQQVLIGGALTGVVLGIAAQQPLSNLFAGLVLLLTRPVGPRQAVRVHSGALGGPLEGSVVETGLMYTVLEVDGRPCTSRTPRCWPRRSPLVPVGRPGRMWLLSRPAARAERTDIRRRPRRTV